MKIPTRIVIKVFCGRSCFSVCGLYLLSSAWFGEYLRVLNQSNLSPVFERNKVFRLGGINDLQIRLLRKNIVHFLLPITVQMKLRLINDQNNGNFFKLCNIGKKCVRNQDIKTRTEIVRQK